MLGFTASRLLTAHGEIEHGVLLVDDRRVVRVGARSDFGLSVDSEIRDFGDTLIAPGYFDLHIHGSGGFDVMDEDQEALPSIERFLASRGVTSYCPTTVTATSDKILRALERLADAIEDGERNDESPLGRATPLGIHLEGPFLSHAKRGVHPVEHLLPPRTETFESFWQASRGHIRIVTIAPELHGAEELIAIAAKRGVCVSLGHSDADFATAQRAVTAGARHATHTFNAMRPLDHRNPGIAGAVLTDSRLSADIIADGIHLDPAVVKLFANAKGPENTVLITDATAAAGMADGSYHLGAINVEVKNGACTSQGKLAGSVLTMDRAVQNLARFADWSLPNAVAAATRNAARVVGFENKGVLAAGADADFLVLDNAGNVRHTFIGGIECQI